MFEIFLTLTEVLSMLMIFILIFIYSILSSDSLITTISFILYLILLSLFLLLLEYFKLLISPIAIENRTIFESIILFSRAIVYIIGAILFIELIYLLLFN